LGRLVLEQNERKKELPMTRKNSEFPDDRTEGQRRRDLSDAQVEELESAGGVEGGTQAVSAGGPSTSKPNGRAGQSGRRQGR